MSYPINLEVEGKICIVIGGGGVALRKVRGLLAANADVIVIAPEVCNELSSLIEAGRVTWRRQKYFSGCLPQGLLVIAATDDVETNRAAAVEAADKHMLVNVVNAVDGEIYNNNFTVPSVVRRGKLTLTISTDGLSPAVSKMIRRHLESEFNDNFARWIEQISAIRDEVKHIIIDVHERERFWRNVMSNENFSLVQNGDLDKAEVKIRNALDSYRNKS